MEFASYLAGEPWSDSPQCTDPLLAHVARGVNDLLPDTRRAEIAADIPRVIGLRGDHRTLAPVIAMRAAAAALPVASAGRQSALASALVVLPALLPNDVAPGARAAARESLDAVPLAHRAALERFAKHRPRERDLRRAGCAATVHLAITSIAEAAINDPATLLVTLLKDAISDIEDVLQCTRTRSRAAASLGSRSRLTYPRDQPGYR